MRERREKNKEEKKMGKGDRVEREREKLGKKKRLKIGRKKALYHFGSQLS